MKPSAIGSLLALFVAPLVLAIPSTKCAPKVKETIVPPHGWNKHSVPAPDHTIVLRIGLPQPDFHVLEKHLYEVSDPDHERYGAHLSKEEVDELVAPHQESIDLVDEWLQSHGIGESDVVRSPAKDWVTITVPVSLVEKMLDTKYHVWQHTDSREAIIRTTSYSLPSNLHEHIDVIQPTTMFSRPRKARSTIIYSDDKPALADLANAPAIVDSVSGSTVDATCNSVITISCLQQLYNFAGFTPHCKNNSIGITGYLGEYANYQDLETFYADQRPDALGSSFKYISVNGGKNIQNLSRAGGEADLDVQFAFGISHPIPGTFWSTGGSPPFNPDTNTPTNTNEPYAEWLAYVNAQPTIPLTISTSYGDDEQSVPQSYARRVCNEFAKLGSRGVSLLFSSGDNGVGDGDPNPASQQCITNDGKNKTRFIPAFPASCPYVTAVGGTSNIPEVAVSRFFSGGGFSNYFTRPSYQEKSVKRYLDALPKGVYKGLYNPHGRGYPDVAAQSFNFRVYIGGSSSLIGGTSASSPAFAGVVALLNDVRLSKNQRPLGFLNPLLYSKGFAGLNDITVGHNSGCGTTGFNASKGWDPVTGLGTPNFGKLRHFV